MHGAQPERVKAKCGLEVNDLNRRAVTGQLCIRAQKDKRLRHALRDQQAVEGIFVVVEARKPGDC